MWFRKRSASVELVTTTCHSRLPGRSVSVASSRCAWVMIGWLEPAFQLPDDSQKVSSSRTVTLMWYALEINPFFPSGATIR
jgi:hypothetical protein